MQKPDSRSPSVYRRRSDWAASAPASSSLRPNDLAVERPQIVGPADLPERLVCDGDEIDAVHFSIEAERAPSSPSELADPGANDLATLERQTITRVLYQVEGNKSEAARRLGLTRMQLYGRLRKFGT